ncbi:exonuclease SbcCD subunit D C-terminal domain-containing protein [Moraxella nasicaprae]|uniref:Nuclease SbcCD subunit D n=1 Tax=Moraxella nasicaprae TaxID=2904122 RepID=A0ABY6F3E9_9GAMM|nr:exonuclease SbcCD subunit D C-terminal domain-containing protein [Moraxella nasicaprae]UXZ04616.1 exonuclease SbcCD subunit D C-terminal domain-containing protein [Moraxella nasicaprae]
MSNIKTHFCTQNTSTPIAKPANALRILHTADWHLGKLLHGQARYDEFAKFLDWLNQSLIAHQVDILIVAGDIFDTSTPSNRAEQLYHQFLAHAYRNQIKHIVIVAGNHDSPTSLQKTKEVLGVLNTQVIGHISDDIGDEVLTLTDTDGSPLAIVMAVPYLRDRDVRTSGQAQDIQQKTNQLLQGVANHYQQLFEVAHQKQQALQQTTQRHIPIIATGHLFAAGSSISSDDDGMRDLQVGTLGQISGAIFDERIDYVALGHIHAAQQVAGKTQIRYSGSPIAMGFGEIGREKQVLLIDFQDNQDIQIHSLFVPIFQNLAKIWGDWDEISTQIDVLKTKNESVWLEVEYTGKKIIANLRSQLTALLDGSQLAVLSLKNKTLYQGSLQKNKLNASLQELDELAIFEQRLAKEELDDEEKQALKLAYQTLLQEMHDADTK